MTVYRYINYHPDCACINCETVRRELSSVGHNCNGCTERSRRTCGTVKETVAKVIIPGTATAKDCLGNGVEACCYCGDTPGGKVCSACGGNCCCYCYRTNPETGEYFCMYCLEFCRICHEPLWEHQELANCDSCDCGGVHAECLCYCERCDSSVCSNCSAYCQYCSERHCMDCCDNCRRENGLTLKNASRSPKIYEYCDRPEEWSYHKDEWEGLLLMGVELEMNFPATRFLSIADIATKYLQDKHLWKADGSLDSGAELVITPHSLGQWRKVDWRSLCRELKQEKCSSYTSGDCGLHVHCSRNAISRKVAAKVKRFLCANRNYIHVLSMRNDMSKFRQWSKIPNTWNSDYWSDRYVAFRRTRETYEFRMFRGTLNPTRIVASIQWCDAMINFAIEHSVASCRGPDSLGSFRRYIETRKQYSTLYRWSDKYNIWTRGGCENLTEEMEDQNYVCDLL